MLEQERITPEGVITSLLGRKQMGSDVVESLDGLLKEINQRAKRVRDETEAYSLEGLTIVSQLMVASAQNGNQEAVEFFRQLASHLADRKDPGGFMDETRMRRFSGLDLGFLEDGASEIMGRLREQPAGVGKFVLLESTNEEAQLELVEGVETVCGTDSGDEDLEKESDVGELGPKEYLLEKYPDFGSLVENRNLWVQEDGIYYIASGELASLLLPTIEMQHKSLVLATWRLLKKWGEIAHFDFNMCRLDGYDQRVKFLSLREVANFVEWLGGKIEAGESLGARVTLRTALDFGEDLNSGKKKQGL